MLKISHRGNLAGPTPEENQPQYILAALDRGFDVEVDVWYLQDKLWSGHDSAQYLLSTNFMRNESVIGHVWFHCKNLEALNYFAHQETKYVYFWHQTDDYTLTSNGYIWAYPERPVSSKTIIVDLDNTGVYSPEPHGVCSDYWNE